MNQKEKQLEIISEKVSNYKPIKYPPIFEVFITLISLVLAMMFFLFPGMLEDKSPHGIVDLYGILLLIMPQSYWAFMFFGAGMIKGAGMLTDNKPTRIVGLIISTAIYAVFAITYSISFPTIGSVVFTGMSVFSLISVSEVKRTRLIK